MATIYTTQSGNPIHFHRGLPIQRQPILNRSDVSVHPKRIARAFSSFFWGLVQSGGPPTSSTRGPVLGALEGLYIQNDSMMVFLTTNPSWFDDWLVSRNEEIGHRHGPMIDDFEGSLIMHERRGSETIYGEVFMRPAFLAGLSRTSYTSIQGDITLMYQRTMERPPRNIRLFDFNLERVLKRGFFLRKLCYVGHGTLLLVVEGRSRSRSRSREMDVADPYV